MWKGILLVLTGACSFGILSTIVKLGYQQGFTLGELCALQAGIGMVILWLLHFFSRAPTPSLKHRDVRTFFILGSSTGMVSITYYLSVQYIPASVAIILLMQFTWMSMLAELIIYQKRPSPIQWVAVALILTGTLMASGILNHNNATLHWQGLVFGLLAALCYTIFIVTSSKASGTLSPVVKSAWMVTGAFVLICCIFPPAFIFNGKLTSTPLLLWGLPLAIFGTVLPPLLFSKGMPKTGLALGAILSAVELPVAVLSATIMLKEAVSLIQVAGIFIILLAIAAANLRKRAPAL